MCTTTSHYETHVSTECSTGGSAQCDGYCEEHGTECTCGCHGWGNGAETVEQQRDQHDEDNDVVDSFEVAYPYGEAEQGAAWQQADARAKVLAYGTSKQFRAQAGQQRVVVVERY